MKIVINASLCNSYGEYEDGYSVEVFSLADAIKEIETRTLSDSPDCSMSISFKLFYDETLVYEGNSKRLRELAATEIAERKAFQILRGEDFSENNLQDYLYKKREWLITEVGYNSYEEMEESVVGIWTGTQHDVIEYKNQFESEKSWYDYQLIDHLN